MLAVWCGEQKPRVVYQNQDFPLHQITHSLMSDTIDFNESNDGKAGAIGNYILEM